MMWGHKTRKADIYEYEYQAKGKWTVMIMYSKINVYFD